MAPEDRTNGRSGRAGALIVGVTILCIAIAAIAGSAVADRGAQTSVSKRAVNKIAKKVAKKQAKKQIKRAAPTLSVASAETAKSADSAKTVETVQKSGIVKLTKGETKTVLTFGPFSVVAECTDSGGDPKVDVGLASTETGSVFDTGGAAGGGPFGGPGVLPWLDLTGPGPLWYGFDYNLAAPSGATYTGSASGGVNVFGSDCAATAYAVG